MRCDSLPAAASDAAVTAQGAFDGCLAVASSGMHNIHARGLLQHFTAGCYQAVPLVFLLTLLLLPFTCFAAAELREDIARIRQANRVQLKMQRIVQLKQGQPAHAFGGSISTAKQAASKPNMASCAVVRVARAATPPASAADTELAAPCSKELFSNQAGKPQAAAASVFQKRVRRHCVWCAESTTE